MNRTGFGEPSTKSARCWAPTLGDEAGATTQVEESSPLGHVAIAWTAASLPAPYLPRPQRACARSVSGSPHHARRQRPRDSIGALRPGCLPRVSHGRPPRGMKRKPPDGLPGACPRREMPRTDRRSANAGLPIPIGGYGQVPRVGKEIVGPDPTRGNSLRRQLRDAGNDDVRIRSSNGWRSATVAANRTIPRPAALPMPKRAGSAPAGRAVPTKNSYADPRQVGAGIQPLARPAPSSRSCDVQGRDCCTNS